MSPDTSNSPHGMTRHFTRIATSLLVLLAILVLPLAASGNVASAMPIDPGASPVPDLVGPLGTGADSVESSADIGQAEGVSPQGEVYTESVPTGAGSKHAADPVQQLLVVPGHDEAASPMLAGFSGGYEFLDSSEPGGPALNFENIAGSGTHIGGGGLTTVATVALPFGFGFYGVTYTSADVSPNGFLSFLAGAPVAHGGVAIPSAGAPNAIVAALWADWAPTGAGGSVRPNVYYQALGTAPNRRFIVQWDGASGRSSGVGGCSWAIGDSTDSRVQIKLYESSNDVEVQYDRRDGPVCQNYGTSAGIEDETGTVGLRYQWIPPDSSSPLGPDFLPFPLAVLYTRW